MKYYSSKLLMKVSPSDLYKIHSQLDGLIQERCNSKFPYSYSIDTVSEDRSMISIRSLVKLNLPGEECQEIIFARGDIFHFEMLLCNHSNKTSGHTKHGMADKEHMINETVPRRLSMAGFHVISSIVSESHKFKINKPKTKNFILGGNLIIGTVEVIETSSVEQAFIYGVGKKRIFGFGQLLNFSRL